MKQVFTILFSGLLVVNCAVDLRTEEYRMLDAAVNLKLEQIKNKAGTENRKAVALIMELDQQITKLCKRVSIYDSALKIEMEGNVLFQTYSKALEQDNLEFVDLEKVIDKSLLLEKLKSNELTLLQTLNF